MPGISSMGGRQKVPADERTAEQQQRLMNISPLLIPNAQAAKLV
jgi:hypothetical protein